MVEVVAFFTWLIVGRSTWFYIDEWDFLAGRKAGDVNDLFRPHNGHWTTLPVLAFRLLYWAFGLRVYLPYRIVVIVLYLTAAALMLVLMRRTGVDPWIATAAATFFALFGAGWENIILPFQITVMGSFTFGLVYLLLADHDGPFDRRDWLGILAGVLALMCSAVGLVMVAAVGAAVLMRRGWHVALRYVVPPAACYAIWLVAIGHRDTGSGVYEAGAVTRFAAMEIRATFGALGPAAFFGIVLGFVLIVGLVLASNQRRGADRAGPRLTQLAAPVALLAGALMLVVLAAVNGAGFGSDWARQSRYVGLLGAMTLPALAVAADALTRRWNRLLPFAVALFLVGIPANLHAAAREERVLRARDTATRSTMLSLAHDPLARTVPRTVRPEPTTAFEVTIGWLLDAEAHGNLPAAPRLTPDLKASDQFRLSFVVARGPTPSANCRSARRPFVIDLRKGDRIGLYDDAAFLEPSPPALIGLHMLYTPIDQPITVLRDVGPTGVTPVPGGTLRICIARR